MIIYIVSSVAGSATVDVSRSCDRGKTIAPASGANSHIHRDGVCVSVCVCDQCFIVLLY